MGIERSQAPSVQKSAEPQPNKARNTQDSPDQAGGFAAVMQAQEPPEAPPAPEAKGAEKTAAKPAEKPVEKTNEAKAQDDEAKASDADDAPKSSTDAQKAAQDAAAALVAAYLLGTPAAPQPSATGKGQPSADGQLAGIDADLAGTEAALKDGSKGLAPGAAAGARCSGNRWLQCPRARGNAGQLRLGARAAAKPPGQGRAACGRGRLAHGRHRHRRHTRASLRQRCRSRTPAWTG
jgi:hypothetical protein